MEVPDDMYWFLLLCFLGISCSSQSPAGGEEPWSLEERPQREDAGPQDTEISGDTGAELDRSIQFFGEEDRVRRPEPGRTDPTANWSCDFMPIRIWVSPPRPEPLAETRPPGWWLGWKHPLMADVAFPRSERPFIHRFDLSKENTGGLRWFHPFGRNSLFKYTTIGVKILLGQDRGDCSPPDWAPEPEEDLSLMYIRVWAPGTKYGVEQTFDLEWTPKTACDGCMGARVMFDWEALTYDPEDK